MSGKTSSTFDILEIVFLVATIVCLWFAGNLNNKEDRQTFKKGAKLCGIITLILLVINVIIGKD